LKARLAYRRQLDSCTGATGKFRDLCDEALAQMKLKMQQEGIW
jgi:hypothetical protein